MSDEPEAPLPPDALEQWAGGVEDELRRLAAEIERLTALTTKHGSYLKLATKRANAMPGKDRSLTLTPEEEALIQSPLSAVFAKALEGMRRLPLMGGERHRPWADHRVDDAAELDNCAVAGALDDAAVMHADGRIDQVASERPQPGKDAILVGSSEARVADHVGHEDCR
jgi:hypothetical protein